MIRPHNRHRVAKCSETVAMGPDPIVFHPPNNTKNGNAQTFHVAVFNFILLPPTIVSLRQYGKYIGRIQLKISWLVAEVVLPVPFKVTVVWSRVEVVEER